MKVHIYIISNNKENISDPLEVSWCLYKITIFSHKRNK